MPADLYQEPDLVPVIDNSVIRPLNNEIIPGGITPVAARYALIVLRLLLAIGLVGTPQGGALADEKTTPGASDRVGAESAPFKFQMEFKVRDETILIPLYFASNFAFETDPDDATKFDAIYDLNLMSWREGKSGKIVQLADCEKWGRASIEMTRTSLAKTQDAAIKHFIERTIDPRFEVEAQGNVITIFNDVLRYRVSDPLPLDAAQRKQFFAYDRLNAYRKAMIERKFTPTAQLVVDDELERLQIVPGRIELEIKSPGAKIQLNITARKMDMSQDELNRVAEQLKQSSRNQ